MPRRNKGPAAAAVVALAALAALVGCGDVADPSQQYETTSVRRGDISVVVEASGTIEPISSVEVKSKASGEILELGAEIGDTVESGQLLVRIDPRTPRNHVAQAEAEVAAAAARLATAKAQLARGEKLAASAWINDAEYEALELAVANTRADEIAARVALENARIALEDTEVRASASGTILTRLVEPGQVISSPTQDVGGGTLLLTMADLGRVRARVRVDETDIGKLSAGISARIRVAAYPGRVFSGAIEKIEPQAVIDQNVTLFAVLIGVANEEGLLRPGMNVDAVFDVARREAVLTLPLMALRAPRDIETTAEILGIDAGELRRALDQPEAGAAPARRVRAAAGGEALKLGGGLWVVAMRDGQRIPVAVETGITDLDRVEITAGLAEGDDALLLPTASLVEIQQQIQNISSRRSGIPGLTQRPQPQTAPARPPER
ncbi:MAG TPA: efflux RND transporter periplasmic adaptor subunit [Steroidobacteraceae bacterium]|nr:efflux RND transporter periplasmic adaptor subunit [Steroidobacteraceae bacterium]